MADEKAAEKRSRKPGNQIEFKIFMIVFCLRSFEAYKLSIEMDLDIVVRRQSQHLGRQLSGSYDDSGSDEVYAKKSEYLFDIKKWEWGQLRVSDSWN